MVIKSVTVIAIAAICILVAAFIVLRCNQPIEEGFLPVYISPKTIQKVLLPRSDVKLVDESMVLYSRGDKQLALTAVEYDTYLQVLDFSRDHSGNTIANIWRPFDIIATNARVFSRFNLGLPTPTNAVVNETSRLTVSEDGIEHIKIYKGSTDVVKSWGLKTLLPPSDLILHDACKAVTQNVFTTTEVAKFQNVQGCTVRYTVRESEFTFAFCITRHRHSPQFIGVRSRAGDLHVAAYNMTRSRSDGASRILEKGTSYMTRRRSPARSDPLSTDVVLKDAVKVPISNISLEALPGQLRVILTGKNVKKAFAFNMQAVLRDRSVLLTDLAWPPQVAWRTSSGSMSLFTFPMCDLR